MKASSLLLIPALTVLFAVQSCAQDITIKEKIGQVENGLLPPVQTEGQAAYNINDRMAFYHVKHSRCT
ncbi:hypothetical protein [Mucilaginibacter sp. UR6-11]|uniref:hypothetical protein n=1 Tax=Mucilaginibacter sp. UR6-11 TaxID=1435644 RepID=UPI001E2DFC53|nr:hypothetical protein [Mucilaginibacter sp. UR6-11]MCC8424995.1 hypothetical protein [Mucilaginibacter sp. UR6-11]